MTAHAAAPTRPNQHSRARNAIRQVRESPAGVWVRHLVEMVVAMYVGMAILAAQIGGIVTAIGHGDLHVVQPHLATLLMAFEMALPMAVWMDHRGHTRRSILEMTAVAVAPAPAAIFLTPAHAMDVYHFAMLASMIALMVYRWGDYSNHRHGQDQQC